MARSDDMQEQVAGRTRLEAQADVRRLLELAQEGMGVVRNGHWVHVNHALARQLGAASPEEVVGTDALWSVVPTDHPRLEQHLHTARTSRTSLPGVMHFVRRDGAITELEVSLTSVESLEGPGAVAVVTRDVSERRRLFDRFVAADRTAALGALAASVAHGINNPLAQIYSNIAFAKSLTRRLSQDIDAARDGFDSTPARNRLQSLSDSIERLHEGALSVANITRNMGLFTLQSEAEGRVELGRILDAAVDLTENIIRHRARLTCEVGVLPAVQGSEARIGHLLLSALLASAQAIPEGDAQAHELRVRGAPDGDSVRIEITDTGERRSEPLDVTDLATVLDREVAPGGLPLAICRALATEMGASLEVMPLDRGTRVTITLRPTTRPLTPMPAAADPEGSARSGRVLVIDDEPVLLDLMCSILRLDHEVDGANDPYDALSRIERGERYDVILCDLMMPTMSGVDLHARIARFAPHVARRMIFLTAGAFTEKAREFLASGGVTWFEKPIEPDYLRRIIRERVTASR